MTCQMTIWMFRRHDDFRSATPIVEIAMQLHVTSASKKVGGLSPVIKVGDLSPCLTPCSDHAPTFENDCRGEIWVEFLLKFVAEINAFWWDFDAILSPTEIHNYRPTSILLDGSGLQSNLVLVHWLTQSEPYDYEYESTNVPSTSDGLWSYVESSIRPSGLPPAGCTNEPLAYSPFGPSAAAEKSATKQRPWKNY